MKGKCLCESVTLESDDLAEFEEYHCSMSSRWGGARF